MPAASKPTLVLALGCGALPGLFLLLTSTTHLVDGQFVYDVKRLLQLCLMLALFLAAGLNPALRNAFAVQFARIPTRVKALLGLIIVLGIISSAVAATSGMHLAYSLLEVALLTMLVLAALVIAACRAVAGETFDQVAITLLALTAIAVGIQELLGVAAALANDLEFYFRISLMHYSWPRFYNQVQAWALPVLAALPLVWSRSRSDLLRSRWFQAIVCLAALALHWYIILMTGARGVALSLAAAFAICLILFSATRRPSLRWHFPGLVLGAVLFFAIAQFNERAVEVAEPEPTSGISTPDQSRANPSDWFQRERGQTRFDRQSMTGRLTLDSSGRVQMWRGSLRDIKAHPLLGIGPMNYACTGSDSRGTHPHNFPLQFAQEWGLPATLALVLVLGAIATTLWKQLRLRLAEPVTSGLSSLLATGLVAAAGYSLLSGVLVMPASQVAGFLIGGWLMGLYPAGNGTDRRIPITGTAWLLGASVICAATAAFSVKELGQREYREQFIPVLAQGAPRYWQQGKQCNYFKRY